MTDETVKESKEKYIRRKILEHLLGPFGSILFHILLIYAALHFTGIISTKKPAEIKVTIMEPDAIELEEFEKELEQIEELQEMTDFTPQDQMIDVAAPPDVSTETAPPSEDVSMDLASLNVLSDAQSPLVMKGLYEGRSESGRSKMLGAAGRWAEQTERAVVKSLEWLKQNQTEDGSWRSSTGGDQGDRMMVGITGVALLAFLAHGETPSSEKYGATVERAIRYLVGRQTESGHFVDTNDGDAAYKAGTYGQAIATYAISEAYALTRIPSLKPAMEKAVGVIMAGQRPEGMWFYRYEKSESINNSVSGWQMQALKAASMAGATNPGLKEALDLAVSRLKERQHESGRFYYIQPYIQDIRGDDHGITAVSVLCLQLLGHSKSKEARKGLQALGNADIDWQKPPPWPMSVWYYVTQAKFHEGGQAWASWNEKFAREYTRNQNDDGSWSSPARDGATIPYGFEHFFGNAFSTAMSALTLQVYYRFLPTYKPIEVEPEEEKSGDIKIEII